jgi:transcription termination factor NusB
LTWHLRAIKTFKNLTTHLSIFCSFKRRRFFYLIFLYYIDYSLNASGEKININTHTSDEELEKALKKDGLYPLLSLVHPISLRFKYHFEGKRQTNRVDKPEWYFTHVINLVHEHKPFMENHIQPLLEKTSYKNINAQVLYI